MPHISPDDLAAVFYTVSAVLFILALRGLSSPETSRRGNISVSYTHLRAHETEADLVCRLLLEKKK